MTVDQFCLQNKIVFPQVGLRIGGSIVSTATIACYLENHDYQTKILLPSNGPATEYFISKGLDVCLYGLPEKYISYMCNTQSSVGKMMSMLGHFITYRKAVEVLLREKPKLIHINNDATVWSWGYAGKKLSIPVVWHVRQENPSKYDWLRIKLCDYIVFVSENNKLRFSKFKKNIPPHRTIANGVDTEEFCPGNKMEAKRALGLNPNMPVVGFVGNWVPRKRPEWFVEAAIFLLKEGYNAQFILVGADFSNDSYAKKVMRKVEEEGLASNIIWLGYRNDIATLMKAFDIFALCSAPQGEALPRVILEAMATAVPVVAANVAGVSDEVIDGQTGILVDPDDKVSFSKAIGHLLENQEKRESMGENGRERAIKHFSIEAMGNMILEVYRELKNG